MNRDQQRDLAIRSLTTSLLPPAMVKETAWDILVALRAETLHTLSLKKLASLISVPPEILNRWLSKLEDRGLVTAANVEPAGELRPVLTRAGRDLLDSYLSSTSRLQAGTRH